MLTPYQQHLRSHIIQHPVYSRLQTVRDLCVFMEYHVVAVWDFMSLLKALQSQFTCIATSWTPTSDPLLRRMINEIVLEEESDRFENGQCLSHFEFYMQAMKSAGANTEPMSQFIQKFQKGQSIESVMAESQFPDEATQFIKTTLECIASKKWHAIAAVFAYTREGLIPDMFGELVKNLANRFPRELNHFVQYLNRHIELDGGSHAQLADAMVKKLCGDNEQYKQESEAEITQALQARIALWNGIEKKLKNNL